MARYTKEETEKALQQLREWLKPGDTVNCISRHTSRSGMSRSISLFAFPQGATEPAELDYFAARVLGESIDGKHGGIRIGGCGMDMGFALVYNLSSRLFPEGFGCIGDADNKRCPSNDHSNGDRDYTPHPGCGKPDARGHRDHWHTSGGYALRYRWL